MITLIRKKIKITQILNQTRQKYSGKCSVILHSK